VAYRFAGTSDYVEFAMTPLLGSLDATTVAVLFRSGSFTNSHGLVSFNTSALGQRGDLRTFTDSTPRWFDGASVPTSSLTMPGTTAWYVVVFTKVAGSGAACRFHTFNGTTWAHGAGSSTAAPIALVSGDRLRVGIADTNFIAMDGDIAWAGVKKADSTDLAVEALGLYDFTAWSSFGFNWLARFNASSTRTNLANPGSGDEIARSGTTLVADPTPPTPVADFTGTPTSGVAPLTVTFTNLSSG